MKKVIVSILLWICASAAWAEEIPETPEEIPETVEEIPETVDDDAAGTLTGVIFQAEEGVPLSNGIVFSEAIPASGFDLESGSLDLMLPSGNHTLLLSMASKQVVRLGEVRIVSGQTTEIIASVNANGELVSFETDSPADSEEETVPAVEDTQADVPLLAIEGRILHDETGDGIGGMRIFVRGREGEVLTDAKGHFRFVVPSGTWDLSAIHPEFNTVFENDIVVEGEPVQIELKASPMGVTLSDYVVSAPRVEGGMAVLLDERRESTAVEDIIGTEQMSKSGDSTAASALKRVTGITVVGGKYVYVRGMGERYSSTLFNGAMIPSPEPERRVIPLDMFPAGMLESVVIQKTFSPEMPGEFGGGTVVLRSRNYPEEFVFDVSLGAELVTGTTFSQGWRSPRGPTDFLGVDGGYRDLHPEFIEATRDRKLVEGDLITPGYTLEDIERFGELLPQQWKTWKKTIPPNTGGSLTVGNTFRVKKIKLGLLASGLYDNEWDNRQTEYRVYNMGSDGLQLFHDYDMDANTNDISTGLYLATGIEFSPDHSIRSTTMLNRSTENMTRWYRGHNRDLDGDLRIMRIRWIERQLLAQQVLGEHRLPPLHDLEVKWRYTFSRARRHEPLTRQVRYDLVNEERDLWLMSNRPDGNSVIRSVLYDDTHDLGAELAMPFEINEHVGLKLTGGVSGVLREREVDTRRFRFNSKKGNSFPFDGGPLALDPEELFTDEYIGPYMWPVEGEDGVEDREFAGLEIFEDTQATDNYRAEQEIFAGYGKLDVEVMERLKVMGGVRVEKSSQIVETFELFTATPQVIQAKLVTTDVLPAGTVSWEFVRDMILRAGYGRTVSRPEFRELSEARFNDVTGGRDTYGNPDLTRGVIQNFDARWDWFPNPGEILSMGLFLKLFETPIEVAIDPAANEAQTWRNAKGAKNMGIEMDFKKYFDFIHDVFQDVFIAGNAALIYSRVELHSKGVQTSNERALQGQSPYVLNLQFGYDSSEQQFSAMLLYNVFGKRIYEVGHTGLPDSYEQPFHHLSLVVRKKFRDRYGLSFKIDNILNQAVQYLQGDKVTQRYRPGVSFSMGLGFSM
jgi:outer membrane receptor protein involved in Fe transport